MKSTSSTWNSQLKFQNDRLSDRLIHLMAFGSHPNE
jgi:hypothetical protein